jgi:hypothetical protein
MTADGNETEAIRWEALATMMKIVTAEGTAEGVVSELNPLVPTREGWSRANAAYFGERWTRTSGYLERLFEEAQGVSEELDAHAQRLLRTFADWEALGHDDQAVWVAFLRKAGVVDHLRPVPAITSAALRVYPGSLPSTLVQRAGLPPDQARALARTHGGGA